MRRFEKISELQFLKDIENGQFIDRPNYNDVKIPQRATSKSAGYDIYSPVNVIIPAHQQIMIPTGLKVNMEDDDVMLIIIRSSLGIKRGLSIPNQTCVIDADYYNNINNEGHFWVCLKNNTSEPFHLEIGDRFSQAIFIKYNKVDNDEPIQKSRDGGFGSTN